jgi:hypothetical protein
LEAAVKLSHERPPLGERLPVDAAAIERELASMWQSAGADQGQGLVTRACAWNVIAHAELRSDREGASGAEPLIETLKQLPQKVASRTLILQTMPDEADRPPLESWISANCALAEHGKYVCSEEITIAARGRGDRHLPGLVRALTVPDVPIAVVFAGVPDWSDPVIAGLIEAADRLVVDAGSNARLLARITRLPRRPRLGAIDLGWIDGALLRSAIADRFDRISSEERKRLKRVEVRGPAAAARLAAGWLGAQLQGLEPAAMAGANDALEARFTGGEEIVIRSPIVTSPVDRLARALERRADEAAFERALEIARHIA